MGRLPTRAPKVRQEPSRADGVQAAWRRPLARAADNRLVLATGVAAALPVIIAVGEALVNRWVPLQDNGIIVLRSWDVFSEQSPLVGQYSQATAQSVGDAYSPGPLLYWLLAPPLQLFGLDGIPLAIGLVNIASIMGAVALARRRGGLALLFATAVGLALVCQSVPAETLRSPFNPTVPLLLCTLLIFLSWSLACGEYRWLPLTALVASFVTQTHLSYALPSAGLLAIGVGGLALEARRTSGEPSGSSTKEPRLRWVLAAVAVALACWSAPLVEEVVHDPGNFTVLAETATADRETLGAETAWHAVVQAFGAPPWWLRPHVDDASRFDDVARDPRALSVLSLPLVLGGLLYVTVVGWRRGRREVAIAGCLAIVLIVAFGLVAASTPADKVLTLGYTMQWGSPAGMFAWLALAFGLLKIRSPGHSWMAPTYLPRGRARQTALAGLAVVAGIGAVSGFAQPPEPQRWLYQPARSAIVGLESALPAGRTVFLSDVPFDVQGLFAYALRRHGLRVLVPPNYAEATGSFYDVTARLYDNGVVFRAGERPAPRGGRIVARIPIPAPRPPAMEPTFTLALGPGGEGPTGTPPGTTRRP